MRQRCELWIRFGSYEDFYVGCVTEFLDELAAVTARGGGDGEGMEIGFRVEREVCEEELFGVDGVVKWEVREFEVNADEHFAGT